MSSTTSADPVRPPEPRGLPSNDGFDHSNDVWWYLLSIVFGVLGSGIVHLVARLKPAPLNVKRFWLVGVISSLASVVLLTAVPILFAVTTLNAASRAAAPTPNQTPLAKTSASPSATQPAVTASSPLQARLSAAAALPNATTATGAASDKADAIIASLNLAWRNACLNHNPSYLWSAFDTGSIAYQQWSANNVATCGIMNLSGSPTVANDPQAAAGLTSRWYSFDVNLMGAGSNVIDQPYLVRLVDGHWLLSAQAPAVGTGYDAMEKVDTGQANTDNHAVVVAGMSALREQAFIQHSPHLLAAAFNNSTSDPAYQVDVKHLNELVPSISLTNNPANPDSAYSVNVIVTETFADGSRVATPTQINWWGQVWTIG